VVRLRRLRMFVSFWLLVLAVAPHCWCQSYLMMPMDEVQTDHLKAYGIVYGALRQGIEVEWLLNFRAGSFVMRESKLVALECRMAGVTYETLNPADRESLLAAVQEGNHDVVLLEKAPRIAVYSPPGHEPWDDAVTLVLTYANIPHDTIWDPEIQRGDLDEYDWLHLHHEDFTGQYGKFYASFRTAAWYQDKVKRYTLAARKAGFKSVSEHKGQTAVMIRDYVARGGFLFAMCSACDTLDIALAAQGVDICAPELDGTPIDREFVKKLDFTRCLAFQNFELITSPYVYEYSNIDVSDYRNVTAPEKEAFVLFEFSAKFDPVETMLTQTHDFDVKGYFGQTTSFRRSVLKPSVRILGDMPGQDRVKYIHGNHGRGTFTFLAGHDPEDFSHQVGDPPTELALHKNSSGYRLILNNVLFPAAKKKHRKT